MYLKLVISFLLLCLLFSCTEYPPDQDFIDIDPGDYNTATELLSFKIYGNFVCFSPDDKYLMALKNKWLMKDFDPSTGSCVILYNAETGSLKRSYHDSSATGFRDVFVTAAFSPDGKYIAGSGILYHYTSYIHDLLIWETETGVKVDDLYGSDGLRFNALAYSSTGDSLIGIKNNDELYIWDLDGNWMPEEHSIEGLSGIITLNFTKDGKSLYSYPAGLWKLDDESLTNQVSTWADFSAVFPDGLEYVYTNGRNYTTIYNIKEKRETETIIENERFENLDVQTSKTGKYFAVWYYYDTDSNNKDFPRWGIKIRNRNNYKLEVLIPTEGYVSFMDFSNDDKKLAVCFTDGKVVVYKIF